MRIVIERDDWQLNPREQYDHTCKMLCLHGRYELGDKHEFKDAESLEQYVNSEVERGGYALPLYLYDHSGITMSVEPFECRWDSGQVGYILMSADSIIKGYGAKIKSDKIPWHIYAALKEEVREYDNYLTGEVYGYRLLDEQGEEISSCWGFYGYDAAEEAAKEEMSHD